MTLPELIALVPDTHRWALGYNTRWESSWLAWVAPKDDWQWQHWEMVQSSGSHGATPEEAMKAALVDAGLI